MSLEHFGIIALLGRRDSPTDALQDYCTLLGQALSKRGHSIRLVRMLWAEAGWPRALLWLWKESGRWRGKWVLAQYTALAWSRRGFPLGFVGVMEILKHRGAKVAVVLHDPSPFGGVRFRDAVRRVVQVSVARWTARRADKLIGLVTPERGSWLKDTSALSRVVHIPVGSNMQLRLGVSAQHRNGFPTVIVFGVTENKFEEAALIAQVIRQAREAVGSLRLVVVGRGASGAESTLRRSLLGSGVELQVHGVLPAETVSQLLAAAHAQLFVRAGISTRHGSAIAGICCGLPVVGYADGETGFPITEAGVRLVPAGDSEGLARELILVLRDAALRDMLGRRSREAAKRYFSWEVIAERFIGALGHS